MQFQINRRKEILISSLLPSPGAPCLFPMPSPQNFCPVLSLSPCHPSSIHVSKFLASIRHFLAASPGTAVLHYPPDGHLGLLVIFSALLPSSASCTFFLQTTTVSSFSASTLRISTVGQIRLVKKPIGCK